MIPFRELNAEEEQQFRQWARDNYQPGMEVSELWHPIVRNELEKLKRDDHEHRSTVEN